MLASQRNNLMRRGQAIGAQLSPATLRFSTDPLIQLVAMRGNFSEQLDLVTGGTEAVVTIAFSIDRALIPVGLTIEASRTVFTWTEANKRLRVDRLGGEGTPLIYFACVDANS